MHITALQNSVRDAAVDGWLFYDFRRSNPIAYRVLGLSEHDFFSRRWCYYVPRDGKPSKLVSAVEPHVLASLPGKTHIYGTWQEYHHLLRAMLRQAHNIAMEYSPKNSIPYVAYVDAGTVELVRSLGIQVVSSADLAQRFEAVLTPDQIESHRAASRALLRVREVGLAWLRDQILAEADLTEYSVQEQFIRFMRQEGLDVPEEEQLVAVNGNASNPHYTPTAEQSAPVRRDDLLLLDFSAPMPGEGSIFADYTWMAFLGAQVPERPAQLFGIIRDARNVGIDFLRNRFETGQRVQGYEVDDVVRGVVAQAGYGEAFIHRTGHNIGTAVHGMGAHLDNLETHDDRSLLINTCTSMEPGIYLPKEGLGLRTEVDVLLLSNGIEVTGLAQEEILPLLAG